MSMWQAPVIENHVIEYLIRRGESALRCSCGVQALAVLDREVCAIAKQHDRPLNILEIGTYNAYSTVVLAQYGLVTSLDIASRPDTQQVIDGAPNRANVLRIVGYGQASIRAISAVRMAHDVAFVDGAHDYENVKRDLETVNADTPVIFCHDYTGRFPGSVQAIDEYVARSGRKINVWGNTSGLCRLIRS